MRDSAEEPSFVRVQPSFSEWGKMLEAFYDRTIYQTPEWLKFLAQTQKGQIVFAAFRHDDRLLGYFCGLIVSKLGLKVLGSPLPGWTTSYMGLNLLPGVPRRPAIDALMRFAFEGLKCVHVELMDRHLTADDANLLCCEYQIFHGFEIDLTQREDQLFANMTSACRRCIRRAEKTGVIIEEARDIGFADEYYEQLQEVFQKQSLVPTYGRDRVRALIRCLDGNNHLLLLRARDAQGRCIATAIFLGMNETMYFWGGASRQAFQGSRPNEAIHWYAMRYWKRRGMCRYDMGGGGEYKRKYGGYDIRVPWLQKSKHAWVKPLRTLAKHMVYGRQRVHGITERFIFGHPNQRAARHGVTYLV